MIIYTNKNEAHFSDLTRATQNVGKKFCADGCNAKLSLFKSVMLMTPLFTEITGNENMYT